MEGAGLLNPTTDASGGRWSARRRASLCQAIPLLINTPALLFNAGRAPIKNLRHSLCRVAGAFSWYTFGFV